MRLASLNTKSPVPEIPAASPSRRRLLALQWAVPVVFVAALWACAPLQTAMEFGGSEGYELMKAFLVSLGHPLYREIWNDQPPLHTEMVALLFRAFGPSAYTARLLSLAFAGLLVGAIYRLVSRRSGWLAGLTSVALLVVAPHVLELSVSVMLEVPAMAVAAASACALDAYGVQRRKRWLWISGALFGLALQVKLTAILFGPAILAQSFADRLGVDSKLLQSAPPSPAWRRWSLEAGLWCGAAGAAFALVLLAFYPPDALAVFWASHFSEGTRMAVAHDHYGLPIESLLRNPASVASVLGAVLIVWKRRWDLLFPVVLLLTVLGIHFWHRPYWFYYDLHFDIPLAWLGAIGLVEGFRIVWSREIRPPKGNGAASETMARAAGGSVSKIRFMVEAIACSLVFSIALVLAPGTFQDEWLRVAGAPSVTEDQTLLALKRSSAGVHWIFTDDLIRASWARLPVPPQLAVIPAKRIWSGQISQAVVLENLKRYQPELIVLRSDWTSRFGLTDYLNAHYRTDDSGLFVRVDKQE